MTPDMAKAALTAFHIALAVPLLLKRFRAMHLEDEMIAQCHELVIDSVSDADLVNVIETVTGENIRDQISAAELIELRREIELRRFERRN